MLGAQARAAELQAAKSAAMRQKAHREATEQLLPPTSAPFSLTDFARIPLPNKNKGTKAFRPLTDSDFEIPQYNSDTQTSTSNTPPTEARTDFPVSAPLAPRAMLGGSGPPLSRSTPCRTHESAFTPRTNLTDAAANPGSISDEPSFASPYQHNPRNTCNYVFGPDDISPTKQETKFTEMYKQQQSCPTSQEPALRFLHHLTPDAKSFTPQQNCQNGNGMQSSGMQYMSDMEPWTFDQTSIQYVHPGLGPSIPGFDLNQGHFDRTQIFAEDLLDHQHRLQQQLHMREHVKTPKSVSDGDRPYDRNSKLQSFVAAQQAMARKGKTVLHNPDLYRSSPQQTTPDVLSPEVEPTSLHMLQPHIDTVLFEPAKPSKTHTFERSTKLEDKEAILRAILRRNATSAHTTPYMAETDQKNTLESMEKVKGGMSLAPFDETLSNDWFIMRPVGTLERQAMLQKVRKITTEPLTSTCGIVRNTASVTCEQVNKRQQDQLARKVARQAAVEHVVDQYEKRTQHASAFGVIGMPLAREVPDLGCRGGLKLVARIMTDLYDDFQERKRDLEINDYTPLDNYAVSMRSAANSYNTSLFDNLNFLTVTGSTN